MNWQDVLQNIGFFSVGTTILGFLCRNIILHFLNKDISHYKEKIKTEFEKEKIKYQTQFQDLHAKRAEIIDELYKKIMDFQLPAKMVIVSATVYVKSKDMRNESYIIERMKKSVEACIELKAYFEKNKLYFNKSFCEKFDFYTSSVSEPAMKFWELIEKGDCTEEILSDFIKSPLINMKVQDAIKEDLENEFRQLLGIE